METKEELKSELLEIADDMDLKELLILVGYGRRLKDECREDPDSTH